MANQIVKTYNLLGLFKRNPADFIAYYQAKTVQKIPQEVIALAEERLIARANKDWASSDALRDKIANLGYIVKDGKDGYTLSKK